MADQLPRDWDDNPEWDEGNTASPDHAQKLLALRAKLTATQSFHAPELLRRYDRDGFRMTTKPRSKDQQEQVERAVREDERRRTKGQRRAEERQRR